MLGNQITSSLLWLLRTFYKIRVNCWRLKLFKNKNINHPQDIFYLEHELVVMDEIMNELYPGVILTISLKRFRNIMPHTCGKIYASILRER